MITPMNNFKPDYYEVKNKIKETKDVYTVELEAMTKAKPGQFYELSINGVGEAPISVASHMGENLKFTIRAIGYLTGKIYEADKIGLRGPYGNHWPYENFDRILAVAGGIGIPPIRSLIWELGRGKELWVIYGARSPEDLVYKYEIDSWKNLCNTIITVDRGNEEWRGNVGLVTQFIKDVPLDKETGIFLIGPAIMMEKSTEELLKYGVSEDNIFLSLERRMECGFGVCGHCNVGQFYVCEDGPIFRYSDVKSIPELFL